MNKTMSLNEMRSTNEENNNITDQINGYISERESEKNKAMRRTVFTGGM
jgi:hypothetical protein